jgi:hypothetical protein
MADYGSAPPAGGNERIGSVERDAAVGALDVHRQAGRLNSAEFEERQVAASRAQTWGEIVPLFSDLPEPRPAKVTALAAYAPPGGGPTLARPGTGRPGDVVDGTSRSGLGLPDRTKQTIVALTPFVALILFFTTHTWLWFLAIPIVAIVLYGGEGKPGGRDRHRDRRRDRG